MKLFKKSFYIAVHIFVSLLYFVQLEVNESKLRKTLELIVDIRFLGNFTGAF